MFHSSVILITKRKDHHLIDVICKCVDFIFSIHQHQHQQHHQHQHQPTHSSTGLRRLQGKKSEPHNTTPMLFIYATHEIDDNSRLPTFGWFLGVYKLNHNSSSTTTAAAAGTASP